MKEKREKSRAYRLLQAALWLLLLLGAVMLALAILTGEGVFVSSGWGQA